MSLVRFRPKAPFAGLAHLVERHLAKVEVASSSLVTRSKIHPNFFGWIFSIICPVSGQDNKKISAGLAHLVERHLAKVEVASSSLVTRSKKDQPKRVGLF